MVATRQRSPKSGVHEPPPTTPLAFGTSRSAASTRPALIDCDLHNELHGDVLALVPYLPDRWKRHLETFGVRSPAGGFYPRFMDHREDARPPSGRRAGSEVAFITDCP